MSQNAPVYPMLLTGLGSWPNIDQAPAPELVFRFMRSQLRLQSSFQGFTNVVKCNIFLTMDFIYNVTIW